MREIKKKFKPYYDDKNSSLKIEHFVLFEMALMVVIHYKRDADPNKGYIFPTAGQ